MANSTWYKLYKNIFIFKNVISFSRTFSTQMRTSEVSLYIS